MLFKIKENNYLNLINGNEGSRDLPKKLG